MTQGGLGGDWSRDPAVCQLRVGRPQASYKGNYCLHVMQMEVNTGEVSLSIKPGGHCVAHSLLPSLGAMVHISVTLQPAFCLGNEDLGTPM